MKILVINGPNMNLLGVRETDIYGTESYETLVSMIEKHAGELGFEVKCRQSNYEGELIDEIQRAYGVFDAIIINPAAYAHTSIAILDALKAVALPVVEVHITNIKGREPFRRFSYVSTIAEKVISGHGLAGYIEALDYLANK